MSGICHIVRALYAIAALKPGVMITNDAMAIVNIRGIGTFAVGVGVDPSSTAHIDGVKFKYDFWQYLRIGVPGHG